MRTLTIALAYVIQIILLIWIAASVIAFVTDMAGRFFGFAAGIFVALLIWFLIIEPVMEWTRRMF
jgi:uncharacterized membrane protein YgaE (UPF0421/DUF939 family)